MWPVELRDRFSTALAYSLQPNTSIDTLQTKVLIAGSFLTRSTSTTKSDGSSIHKLHPFALRYDHDFTALAVHLNWV
jgi:hypothetical protein